MDIQFSALSPMEIEQKSLAIIQSELDIPLDSQNAHVILRVIHASADFDYARNLYFSPNVTEKASQLLLKGCKIVTDTRMAQAGINKKTLAELNCECHCFIDSEIAAQKAKEQGGTRSAAAVDMAASLEGCVIYVVGNAPTALIRLEQLIKAGTFSPALIIAAPVGFVNVAEAKELVLTGNIPCIVARGRKGGSSIAAAIVNALMYSVRRVV